VDRRITRNPYEEHAKHILDTTQIELFNKFIEENCGINVSINIFVQQKPWYVKPITVHDTCCCRYHVEFQLYYDTFLILVKHFGKIHLLLPLSMVSYLKFYVKEKVMNYFTKRNVLVVKNVIIVEI
jgi:hypothetical protein